MQEAAGATPSSQQPHRETETQGGPVAFLSRPGRQGLALNPGPCALGAAALTAKPVGSRLPALLSQELREKSSISKTGWKSGNAQSSQDGKRCSRNRTLQGAEAALPHVTRGKLEKCNIQAVGGRTGHALWQNTPSSLLFLPPSHPALGGGALGATSEAQ